MLKTIYSRIIVLLILTLAYQAVHSSGIDKKMIASFLQEAYYQNDPDFCAIAESIKHLHSGNIDKAVDLFVRHSMKGNIAAKRYLAKYYVISKTNKNKEETLWREIYNFYIDKANQEDKHALFAVGDLCIYTDQFSWKMCFDYTHKSALLDDGEAAYNLSTYFRDGFGVEKNNEKRMEWLKRSAELGSIRGNKAYAAALSFKDKKKNSELIHERLLAAASKADPEAQYFLGIFMIHDLNDKNGGIMWLKKAAEYKHSNAVRYLEQANIKSKAFDFNAMKLPSPFDVCME